MVTVTIQQEPIDVSRALQKAGGDADGALVTFIGRARNASRGKTVLYLEYEAYGEMARKELKGIAEEAAAKWSLGTCTVIHRYGRVDIGEPSVLIIASSPHRDEAFQAVRHIIDTVKKKVPIWKKEYYSDGSSWMDETP